MPQKARTEEVVMKWRGSLGGGSEVEGEGGA